jgi:ubiquinone biosynthesis protein
VGVDVLVILLRVAVELVLVVVSTLLAVRLLGVRRSWVAIAAAGVIGWTAGSLLDLGLRQWDWDATGLSVRTVVFAVLFTMLAAVGLDLVARPGSLARGDRAGLLVLPRPFRDVRRRLRPYRRYRQIAAIARSHGLVFDRTRRRQALVDSSFAVALRQTLEDAGVVFIKLGQMASTRDDLLPDELTTELSRLQSSAEPAPREAMQALLEEELGRSVDEVFAAFDWTPIGSASIAQAYAAVLPSGQEVIVKVQRPDMDEQVAVDAATVLHLARAVERTPMGRDLHARELATEFVRTLHDELDFRLEAANILDIGAAVDGTPGIRVPQVHVGLVTRRVVVEERFRGPSVSDRERMAALGLDPTLLADRLVQAMLDQLLHGHFHADLHPGNVLLLDDGSLGLIDFGLTGRLDASLRSALLDLVAAFAAGDPAGLREGIEQVAVVGVVGQDLALDQALAKLLSDATRSGGVGVEAMNDLVVVLSSFDIHLPSELTTCLRALVLLDGTVRAIDPGFVLIDAVRDRVGAPTSLVEGPAGDQLRDELLRQLPRLRRLPVDLERIAALTARGDLRARVSLLSLPEDVRVLTTLVNRVLLVVAGSALVLGAAVLVTGSDTPTGTSLAEVTGFICLGVGLLLILRVIAAVVRDGYE